MLTELGKLYSCLGATKTIVGKVGFNRKWQLSDRECLPVPVGAWQVPASSMVAGRNPCSSTLNPCVIWRLIWFFHGNYGSYGSNFTTRAGNVFDVSSSVEEAGARGPEYNR